MKFQLLMTAAALAAPIALARPAEAAEPAKPKFGDPVALGDGVTLDPIIDARLRLEHVDQPTTDADAVTLRLRGGFELKHKASKLALLAEAEGTLALGTNYNAFPFVVASAQRRTQFSTVPDAENIELNRLQLQYKGKAVTITLGRQRYNLDDQRFVGAVGWRQNEQTFDAVRGEAKLGKATFDASYAISQRTVFGYDGGPRTAYDGNFVFLGAAAPLGPVTIKGFAYLLDYDLAEQAGTQAIALADTQTFGVRATASPVIAKGVKLNLMASYAHQANYKQNPLSYGADYVALEAALAGKRLGLTVGYEKLGGNGTRSFQTPMATLHKFNGWADLFLVTPAGGLQDIYAGASYKFDQIKAIPGLNAAVTYHKFNADVGNASFGHEWDMSLGFRISKVNVLAKYAAYSPRGFGVSTKKLWLQAEVAF